MNRIQNQNFLHGFSPHGHYLIGVSGGRDSVTLLHWLFENGYRKLVVCHLNHQLRGRASDADARFVMKLVASYNAKIVGQARRLPKLTRGKRGACPTIATPHIDLEIGTSNVPVLAAKQKMSIETAARTARYQFFARVAKRKRCGTIFLAHHADDLVETFLINLFRGAGTSGLSAMGAVSVRKIDKTKLRIVRPFLHIWRDEIDQYVRKHRLRFREDASNKNLAPLRNRIRHRIIPMIEKQLGRKVRSSIWRAATIAAEEENFFDALLPDKLSMVTALAVKPLRAMPVAVQRRMVHEWLRASDVTEVSFDLVERVRELLDLTNRVAKTNLPQDRHVRRRAGHIFIE